MKYARQRWFIGALAVVATFAWATAALAQGRTSSGMFGSRTVGGGFNARSRSAFGSAGGGVDQAQSGAGQVQGNERFLRENRQPGDFVGADQNDASNIFGALTGRDGRGGGLENLRPGGNSLRPGGNNRGQGARSGGNAGRSQDEVRTRLRLGFSPPARAAEVVSEKLQQRMAEIDRIEKLQPMQVTVRGRTAVLRGAVATEHDREIAAIVLTLEPGIDSVENRLTVGNPSLNPPDAPNPSSPSTGSNEAASQDGPVSRDSRQSGSLPDSSPAARR